MSLVGFHGLFSTIILERRNKKIYDATFVVVDYDASL